LEPGDLRLGQVVMRKVAVVKLVVNNGSGDGGSCSGIEVWTHTAKLTDMVIARFGDRRDDAHSKSAIRMLFLTFSQQRQSNEETFQGT